MKKKDLKKNQSEEKSIDQRSLSEALDTLRSSTANVRVVVDNIYTKELWRAGECNSFKELAQDVLDEICGPSQAYRHVRAAKVDRAIGHSIGTVPITVADEISKGNRSPKHIKSIWRIATKDLSGDERPSLKAVKEAIATFEQAEAAYALLLNPDRHRYVIKRAAKANKNKLRKALKQVCDLLEPPQEA